MSERTAVEIAVMEAMTASCDSADAWGEVHDFLRSLRTQGFAVVQASLFDNGGELRPGRRPGGESAYPFRLVWDEADWDLNGMAHLDQLCFQATAVDIAEVALTRLHGFPNFLIDRSLAEPLDGWRDDANAVVKALMDAGWLFAPKSYDEAHAGVAGLYTPAPDDGAGGPQ